MSNENEPAPALEVSAEGVITVPTFALPPSAALSEEKRAVFVQMSRSPMRVDMIPNPSTHHTDEEYKQSVDAFRRQLDDFLGRPLVERLIAAFPVTMTSAEIAGVPVEEFVPERGVDSEQVLINLHGGGFMSGYPYIGRIESIPVAHQGKIRVISIDYRQGYEHRFPAASEDVAAVYGQLLDEYEPGRIGIYGASAGGMLTAQATAWLIDHDVPVPGAIAVLSAGTGGNGDGDFFSAIGTASHPPTRLMSDITNAAVGYFAGSSADDYLVDPTIAPKELRAKFPPTLLITGTRAFDLSPAIAMHRALVQAGVDASLHVFDGLAHSFFYDAVSPESADAYETIIRFFKKHLLR